MVESKKQPVRILVVENDPDILNALNIILGSVGFDVDVLLNGKGILKNQFVLPDLFLIDKQLPDVDGLEICRFLHAKPNYRNVPVIVISSSHRLKATAIEAGASCFIGKPFTVEELLSAIRHTLQTGYKGE